jgi:integrase
VANGIDPSRVQEDPAAVEDADLTVNHFAKLYLEWSEQHHTPALYKINKLSLDNDVLPFWKDTPIAEIGRRDAIALLERVAKRAKGQVSNVQRAARGVFNYALEREYINANPLLNLNKVVPALKLTPRERILSDSEIKTVWESLQDTSRESVVRRALKLVLLTAQRPGEVAGMHRREIEGEWWTIPKGRTKSGREHMVYLTPTAIQLIGSAEGYIFPSSVVEDIDGGMLDQPILRMALSRHVHRAGFFQLPRWTPHDLRRTARTYMERLGIPEAHSEAVLAHSKKGIVKVYNRHEYEDEKKIALLLWEAELLRLLGQG